MSRPSPRRPWWILGLGLFKLAATIFPAAPSNDNLSNAALIDGAVLTVDATNVDATKEIGEPNHGGNLGGRSVWWKWTAPGLGSVQVRTSGSTFDTLLGAYTGTSYASLSQVAASDDTGRATTSTMAFNVNAGATYRIAVDGFGGATGLIHLALAYSPVPLQRPGNDSFTNRINLSGTFAQVLALSFLATKESHEPNHASELGGASLWWSWTAPRGGSVTVDTEGCDFDTLLAVYAGSDLSTLAVVAKNDDISTNAMTSQVRFDAVEGSTYAIAVDGYGGETGAIEMEISMGDVIWLRPEVDPRTGRLQVILTGIPGRKYRLEASTNLVLWTGLDTRQNSTGSLEFSDPDWGRMPRRFYRGAVVP